MTPRRSNKSICTDARRRGTAEVELLLSVIVLLALLFLVRGGYQLMLARMDMIHTAGFRAMQEATASGNPQYTDDGDMPALDGIDAVRPGLPNRMHVPRLTTTVSIDSGANQTLSPKTVGGMAAVASPSWTYSAWPVGSDRSATTQWFQTYADESHSELVYPLGLAPVWTP